MRHVDVLTISSLSMWYPRHKLQLRIGMFWAGATLAGWSAAGCCRTCSTCSTDGMSQAHSLAYWPTGYRSCPVQKGNSAGHGFLCVVAYVHLYPTDCSCARSSKASSLLLLRSVPSSVSSPQCFRYTSLDTLMCTVLFDFPTSTNASFLTPEERAYVIWRKSTFRRHCT